MKIKVVIDTVNVTVKSTPPKKKRGAPCIDPEKEMQRMKKYWEKKRMSRNGASSDDGVVENK